jgi:DNA gyrase inhibitor GyrI
MLDPSETDMADDDITLRHLSRQRVRGAPAAIPGSSGFVPDYSAHELTRQAQRSLICPFEGAITVVALHAAFARLQAVAQAQHLKVTGDPLYIVKSDPMTVVPNQREHEVSLPVRGEAKEDSDVRPSRLEGGYYIRCVTQRGLDDVENVYTWLFGKFLPARKHELTRPYILHRLFPSDGANGNLSVEIQAPATLSIKPVRTRGTGGEA